MNQCFLSSLFWFLTNVVFSGHQGMGGRQAVVRETKPVNSRRYVASFDVENTTKGDSGRYRCIVQSERGVGVSSYADLTVKRESSLAACVEIFLFCLILVLGLFVYVLFFFFVSVQIIFHKFRFKLF